MITQLLLLAVMVNVEPLITTRLRPFSAVEGDVVDPAHQASSFHRSCGKADCGAVEHAATQNISTDLNAVNLMLPQLLKWAVKLKPLP